MNENKADKRLEYKTMPRFEQKIDEEQGLIECLVTTFGILDGGDDISHPGSFAKTITERGHQIRVLDAHRTESIRDIVGKPARIWEVEKDKLPAEVLQKYPEATGGAMAEVQFFMDTPEGEGAFIRAKNHVVEMSYGYDVMDYDHETITGSDGKEITARNLRTVRLWEISLVPWGMNPATGVMSAKAEDEPTEEKPAEAKPVEETENYIRIRIKDPDDFQEGSFITKTLSEEQGIKAVMGRLPDEETLTIQTYLFDKEKWTVETAQAWVDEHEKALKALSHDAIRDAIYRVIDAPLESERPYFYIETVYDDYAVISGSDGTWYKLPFTVSGDEVVFGEAVEMELVEKAKKAKESDKRLQLIEIEEALLEMEHLS